MQEPIQSQPEEKTIHISKKMTTGEVTEKFPATKAVFSKYFGKSCFDCPAFGTEDINLACMMHNTDVDVFVKELIEAAQRKTDTAS